METQLLAESDHGTLADVRVRRLPSVIGRRQRCTVRLTSRAVSREHCVIERCDGAIVVRDLNSSNGTFVNGERVVASRAVRHGDVLELGNVRFRLNLTAFLGGNGEDDVLRTPLAEFTQIDFPPPEAFDVAAASEEVEDERQTHTNW